MEENVIYRSGKVLNMFADVTGNSGYDTMYQWQINDGSGWKDISDLNEDDVDFEISPLDNGSKLRCSAIVMVGGTTACVIYSDPITMNCAKTYNGCTVDWKDDANTVTVTFDEGVTEADVYLKAEDADGFSYVMYKSADSADRTFDLSEIPEGSKITIYIWDDSMNPVTCPFEG